MKIYKAGITFFLLFCLTAHPQSKYDSTYSQAGKHYLKLELNNEMGNSFQPKLFDLSKYEIDPLKSKVNYTILAGLGALYLGTGIGVHIYQRNAWWKDQRTSFHFQNDWAYALWDDKLGHFFAATLLVHAFSAGLEAANFQTNDAMLYGTITALAFQYYVEIEDGFGAQWGFSPGDAMANTLGAGYAFAQFQFPFLQNFQFKYSYYPSVKMRNGEHKGNIFDDYEGQKYWLSFRMKNLLPDKISKVWPDYINLAIGTRVDNLDGKGGGTREVYIALDFNPLALPFHGKFGNFVKNTLNYFHFPMPGLRISPTSAFFVFLF